MVKISTLIVVLGVMTLSVAVLANEADGAGIVWRAINKAGSVLNDIGAPTSSYSFGNQLLQNVKLEDSSASIVDNGDNTKQLKFETSGITTATTRTVTIPDASTTMVGTDASQTLSSKTISLGSNTVSGTTSQFNTALSDDDFVTLSGTETLSGKTLTAPKFADLGFIADANGNEIITLDTIASAVNELTVANAATTTNPKITATGGDTNVGIELVPKGTGKITINDGTDTTKKVNFDVSGVTTGTTRTITLPDASTTLVGTGTTQTLTSKTISLGSNTVSGTTSQFNTALSDGDFATLTRISGSSGAAGSDITWQVLTADAAAITSTTPSAVMTTTGVGTGTWHYRYVVIYQSAATTTGLSTAVDHTGTVSTYIMNTQYVTTGGAAATGISDGLQSSQTAGLWEGKAERTKNTATSATVGVDTATSNIMQIVEGIVVVSASGNLELKIATEVATSGITVKAGTLLELNKIA